MIYFSTFIPGLGEVVVSQLTKQLLNFKQEFLSDGLIVYFSDSNHDTVMQLKFLNNSFIKLNEDLHLPGKFGKTFRVVFSKESELSRVNKERLSKIENKIARVNELDVDRANPDVEVWFLERSEGVKLVGLRITKHPDYKTVLAKGQLRPELADFLCLIANPQPEDTILDPFAGSGAISRECKSFPHKEIISGDIAPKNETILKIDATKMSSIADQAIDKIITDPPWGVSVGLNLDLPSFYTEVLGEFYRVLKQDGTVVTLIGKKELFEAVLEKYSGEFNLQNKYDILVSGKKAAIYKLEKCQN